MTSWRCFGCRTVYPPATGTCPNCEEKTVAKVNQHGAATHYVAEGQPVPADLPEGVALVGPGAVAKVEEVVKSEPAAPPVYEPDDDLEDDDDEAEAEVVPEDYAAQTILALRDLCRQRGLPIAGAKADLVIRLRDDDTGAAAA